MQKRFVLFDFDGVILDSFKLAFEVSRMQHPHMTEDQYRRCFDGNINDADVGSHTPECRFDLDFFSVFVPLINEKASLVPGMDGVIKELVGRYSLVVISSTLTAPIKDLLEKFGLADLFVEVMGNDVSKNKTEKIKMAFVKYGVTARDCIFVTDTTGDMREAAKAAVGSVGVSWGYQSIASLYKENPFRVVEKPQNLVAAIDEYFCHEDAK